MSSHYQLCKKSDGLSALAPLDQILYNMQADPFPAPYRPYTQIVEDDNLGRHIKAGPPTVHWHWEVLSQPDIDALLGYEGEVYVRTEKREGLIREFGTFEAYMQEPQIGDPILPENGVPDYPQKRGPVDVDFITLVAVP